MLNENLKSIRKQKGLSQEELAIRLNVVRQTVSKWEKGLSVPDAEMLIKIAEIFEVSVSDLLGERKPCEESNDEISKQLERINEQLAIKNHRTKIVMKIIAVILAAALVLFGLQFASAIVFSTVTKTSTEETAQEIVENAE